MASPLVASSVTSVTWANTMDMDHGFDTLSCKLLGVAVDTKQEKPAVSTPGQRTTLQLRMVESSQDLQESMGISAQASMKMGVYGGEAKAEFAASHAINSSSVFLVASVVVGDKTEQYSHDTLRRIELDPHLKELYATNPYKFRSRFGDGFISGKAYGGEMYCLLEISTRSREDKANLKVDVRGHGEAFEASASFTGSIAAVTKNRQANVWVYKRGGKPLKVAQKDLTVDKFVEMVGGFAEEINENPEPYSAIVTPYDELPSVPSPPSSDVVDVESEVQELTKIYLGYRDALGDLDYMLSHAHEFVFPPVDEKRIKGAQKTIGQERDRVFQAIRQLTQTPNQDIVQKVGELEFRSVDDLTEGLPQRLGKLPRSAKDLKKQYPELKENGEYDLYLDGTVESRVTLYCKDMATANPREYISLQTDGGRNRSHWPAATSSGQRWRRGKDLTTSYRRIRFDPISRTVDVDDTTFAETSGGPLAEFGAKNNSGTVITHAPYGFASASNHNLDASSQPRTPFGKANVDLRGTPFRIDDGVIWKREGFDPKPSGDVDPKGSQVIEVQGGGAPGGIRPKPELRLALAKSKPS